MEVRVLGPNDVVGEEDLAAGELGLAAAGVDHVVVGVDGVLAVARGDGVDDVGNLEGLLGGLGSGAIAVLVLLDGIVVVLGGLELMLDGEGLDGEANDTVLAGLGLDGMVHDLQVDVVVHVRLLGVRRNETDRESLPVSGGDGGIVLHLGCRRQVVDDPVIVIVLANGPHDLVGTDPLLLSPTEVGDANLLAVHVLLHPKAVRGALDAIPDEELAKILIVHLRPALGLAEREAVVIHRKQSLLGRHFVHLHLDAALGDNIRWDEYMLYNRQQMSWEYNAWLFGQAEQMGGRTLRLIFSSGTNCMKSQWWAKPTPQTATKCRTKRPRIHLEA